MIVLNLPTLLVLAVITGVSAYFASYLREKGKNLATREDVKRIVQKTEEIKVGIAGGLWAEQSRRTFRPEVYKSLLESIGDAASALRQLVFVDEQRPKVKGNAEVEEFLSDMEQGMDRRPVWPSSG